MRRLLGSMCLIGLLSGPFAEAVAKPNFIIILVDDLGYGDLGCYGSEQNRTPNIDRLAAEGVRFTDFHSNGPMCTPTRAALLTGRYQNRLGRKFESALGGREHYNEGLPQDTTTLAEVLRRGGYATGCFGKWHLGYQPPFLPPDHGFDVFRGLGSGDGDHHTQVDRSGRHDWWFDNQRQIEEGYTADLLVQHALDFIETRREEPFFVYLAHLAIHFPWQGPSDPPHRKVGQDYWQDKWGIIPDRSNVAPHVQAMIESVDRGVGRLISALEGWGVERNTVLFFLSDNGGYTHYGNSHQNISSNGPLRGQKTELFEGGHRIPAIAWSPGRFAPSVSDALCATFDLAPTLVKLAGLKNSLSTFDGIDLTHVLLSKGRLKPRDLFWRMDDEGAVRSGRWKWIQLGNQSPMLFDLVGDLSESENLASMYPQRVRRMQAAFQAWEREVE